MGMAMKGRYPDLKFKIVLVFFEQSLGHCFYRPNYSILDLHEKLNKALFTCCSLSLTSAGWSVVYESINHINPHRHGRGSDLIPPVEISISSKNYLAYNLDILLLFRALYAKNPGCRNFYLIEKLLGLQSWYLTTFLALYAKKDD